MGGLQKDVNNLTQEHTNMSEKVSTIDLFFKDGLNREELAEKIKLTQEALSQAEALERNQIFPKPMEVKFRKKTTRPHTTMENYEPEPDYGAKSFILGEETIKTPPDGNPESSTIYNQSTYDQLLL